MFQNWSLKKIYMIFGGVLLIAAIIQVYLFVVSTSIIIHFGMSFVALFIALILFHSVNIKMRQNKKQK
jgi:hypothetical protein